MRKINYLPFIKSLPYFHGVSPVVLKSVESKIKEDCISENEVLDFNARDNVIYVILVGRLKLYYHNSKNEDIPVRFIQRGDIFPVEQLFHSQNPVEQVKATEKTVLLSIPASFLETLIIDSPILLKQSIRLLQENIGHYYEKME